MDGGKRDYVIRGKGLSKVYREGATELRALQEVDLEVRAGELTLLMGPSGSGKTTLLSILGCSLRASEGNLEVLGNDVSALPESELPRIRREGIGFVFQGFNLFPTLTAAENVALALDLRGIRAGEAKKRGEELLAEVGLAQKARSFPADLSGGQKQRVAIARALAGDPPILLADRYRAAAAAGAGTRPSGGDGDTRPARSVVRRPDYPSRGWTNRPGGEECDAGDRRAVSSRSPSRGAGDCTRNFELKRKRPDHETIQWGIARGGSFVCIVAGESVEEPGTRSLGVRAKGKLSQFDADRRARASRGGI